MREDLFKSEDHQKLADSMRACSEIEAKPKRSGNRHRPGYQREYIAKWRRGEVGNKHKPKLEGKLK